MIDYPIICYRNESSDKLIIVNLADPDAQKRTYEIPSGESFKALMEPNNRRKNNTDVQIKLLVQNKEEQFILRTLSYRKPFYKPNDFSDVKNW